MRTDVSLNTVSEGSDVSFMCKARGYPKPQYKFSIRYKGKGETPLTYKEGERTGKFKVTVMDKSFHGTYICIPYNRLGDGPRQELVLYVRCEYIDTSYTSYSMTAHFKVATKFILENYQTTMNNKTGRKTNNQTDGQTDRQAERHTDR